MHHLPQRKRRGQGKLWLGVLLAVIVVGGVGYWLLGQLVPAGGARSPSTTTPSSTTAAPRPSSSPAPSSPGRSDTILTCQAEGGEVFYTNATRCDDADLENRVNVLPAFTPPAPERSDCLGAQASGARVQSFLAVCQEPFNQALELEPLLLDSPDPAVSRAARRYCALITEGVQAGCMATSDQFCFLHLCRQGHGQGGG